MKTATVNLNTKAAREARLGFLLAAARGPDGDLTPLLAYADWLLERGADKRAARVRRDALRRAALPGRTLHGESWLRWHAAYDLGVTADAPAASETAFGRFAYRGNWAADGTPSEDDGSMEAALRRGYVPALRRGRARQRTLGRIIEGLGFRVHWIG